MDKSAGEVPWPVAPLTITSLRNREQKSQMMQANSTAAIKLDPTIYVKTEDDNDAFDVNTVVKIEQDADIPMHDLPETATATLEEAVSEVPQWLRRSISRYNSKSDPRLKRIEASATYEDVITAQSHIAYTANDSAAYVAEPSLSAELRRQESQSSIQANKRQAIAHKLILLAPSALQETFRENFEEFHGRMRSITNFTGMPAYSNSDVECGLVQAHYKEKLNENGPKHIAIQSQHVCVSSNKAINRTIKLSEYIKRKIIDLNDELRRLHGLPSTNSSPTHCVQRSLLKKQPVYCVTEGNITIHDTTTAMPVSLKTASDNDIPLLNTHSTPAKTLIMDTTSQAVPLALEQHTGLGSEGGDWKRTVKETVMNVLAENLESMIVDVVQRKRGLSDRLLGDEDDPTIDTVYKDDSYINKRRKLSLCESRGETFTASHHDNEYIAAAGAPMSSILGNISAAPSKT